MGDTAGRKLSQWIDKIAYLLLGVILFDCMVMGGGSYIVIKGINIRMVWFALFFLFSLPAVFRNFKKLITNVYALCLLVWLGWLIFATVRGYRAGNDPQLILSSLIGFASFGILPGCMAILTEKRRIVGLMKLALVSSVLLSVQTIVLLFMHNLDGESLVRINSSFLQIELGSLSIVDVNVVRIFLRSHPLAVFGCCCAVCLTVNTKTKTGAVLYSLATAFVLFSLLVSFTRSVYLAILVAVVLQLGMCLWILERPEKKRLTKWLATTVLVFLVVLQVFNMVFGSYFLSYGLYRTVKFDLAGTLREKLSISTYVDLTPVPTEPTLPPETKPAETKPPETKPAETKPPETKPAETKPAETKPVETKPAETKPVETKPIETTPVETTPPPTEPAIGTEQYSSDLRTATQQELIQRIKQSPLIGSGMGAVLEVRAAKDKANEYFYLDQTMKLGVIGIVLFMLPMLLMSAKLLLKKRQREKDTQLVCATWTAGLLAIAAFSYYNPYLNGSNGIVLYCVTIAVMSTLYGKQQLSTNKE